MFSSHFCPFNPEGGDQTLTEASCSTTVFLRMYSFTVCSRGGGAFWGLMIGLTIGLIRFGWEFSYAVPSCGSTVQDPRPDVIAHMHYLHFGVLLFVISVIATGVISLLTPPIDDRQASVTSVFIKLRGFKKALFCICGVTSTHLEEEEMAANQTPAMSPEQEAEDAVKALDEHPVWGPVTTLNAVLLMLICAFVWGFYA
ncbi:hypothetical protein V5799_007715 [Amblyomma americanum]|uniref:Uncharacterized protein n=1 Tax=Amblyomma americanum TaxID=6943 RepID=A0AAQ4FF60_AMBAM